ncbi:MAG: M56 family metallopeptidase, partial [Oscillospiraceae bacterium]|nr:M56 family metallopeptidase [Oscillospiraceae bacterium]
MEIFLDVFKWSIIAGAAVLLLTLLKPVLSKRYSARWRYWVWLALAILSLPVRWEMSEPLRTPVEIQVPDVEIRIPGSSISTVPESDGPSVQLDGTGRTWRVQDHLPYIWPAGISLFALYHLSGNLFFRHKVRRWRRTPGGETAKIYGAVCQDMGVKNAPPLWVSGAVGSPMLLGIFRPCLILPGEEWGEQQLSFILRHELTHYRRHDLWYKLVLLAANAVHWFNPLMYL